MYVVYYEVNNGEYVEAMEIEARELVWGDVAEGAEIVADGVKIRLPFEKIVEVVEQEDI